MKHRYWNYIVPHHCLDPINLHYSITGILTNVFSCRLNREWEDIELPDHITKRGTANKRIRIVCYNILSQVS